MCIDLNEIFLFLILSLSPPPLSPPTPLHLSQIWIFEKLKNLATPNLHFLMITVSWSSSMGTCKMGLFPPLGYSAHWSLLLFPGHFVHFQSFLDSTDVEIVTSGLVFFSPSLFLSHSVKQKPKRASL